MRDSFTILVLDNSDMTFMGLMGMKLSLPRKIEIAKDSEVTLNKIKTSFEEGYQFNAILINIRIKFREGDGYSLLNEIRKMEKDYNCK